MFTPSGSFIETHTALSDQATKAIYKLRTYLNKFTNLSVKHTLELFDKLILPILNYASEVWWFSNENKIERIHTKFCKQLLGVKSQTQNNFVYGELGRTTLKVHRFLAAIRYWLKIVHYEDDKYIKAVYKMMLSDMELYPNKKSWASEMKRLIESLGLNYAWLQQGVGNINSFISLCKQRLNDQFIQKWSEEINSSSRADTYKLFSDFGFKPYLNDVTVTKFRKSFTRLRLSSHRLEVEVGRWHKPNKIPRNERKCRICNTLEDEFHFLFECSLYSDIRKIYIKPHFWRYPNMIKFIELMKSDDTTTIRKLANYVHKSFEIRNRNYII